MRSKESLSEKYDRLSEFEKKAAEDGYVLCAGIDEAGRGPLAGPVVAAACILSPERPILGLDDSKKLSAAKRESLYEEIIKNAISFTVIRVENDTIDRINILEATKLAMRQCVSGLPQCPDLLLIDAVDLKGVGIPVIPLIKGDARSNSIAAASILAKVTRDKLMTEYDLLYPGYGFAKHKGYGTKEHYEAIARLGLCPLHRRTFLRNLMDHM